MQQYVISISEDADADMVNGVITMLRSMPFIKLTSEGEKVQPLKREVKFGCLKGKIWMADDFNEEMDEYGRFASEPDFGKPAKEAWE
jgi:hypothetical protein